MISKHAGEAVPRVDAVDKVTGRAQYAIDARVPGMLHGHVLRSTRAHAEIVSIDTTEAESSAGVVAVITADDLGDLFPRFGHIIADHPILAIDRVRYYGEPVALVVANSPHAASDGAELVRVDYRDLPVVIDPGEALANDAPLLHDSYYAAGDRSFEEAQSPSDQSNLAHQATLEPASSVVRSK